MRLACNAPAHLWDEFCATAAYLTNLTMSSSANGTTPHEKWFGTVPSLSHLHEIGCRAFSLIQTHNPKLFRRSTPCTLIGYAPHSKAYCLWDNTTGAIFNSFHVTFVEHLYGKHLGRARQKLIDYPTPLSRPMPKTRTQVTPAEIRPHTH